MVAKLKFSGRNSLSILIHFSDEKTKRWFDIKELKSALQKLYRNGETGYMKWLLLTMVSSFEHYLSDSSLSKTESDYSDVDDKKMKTRMKTCSTNVLNRLVIMMCGEDSQPYIDDYKFIVDNLIPARNKCNELKYMDMYGYIEKCLDIMHGKCRSRFVSLVSSVWRVYGEENIISPSDRFNSTIINEIETKKKRDYTLSCISNTNEEWRSIAYKLLSNPKFGANPEIHRYTYGFGELVKHYDFSSHGMIKSDDKNKFIRSNEDYNMKFLQEIGVYDQHVLGVKRASSVFADVGCKVSIPSDVLVCGMNYQQLEQIYINEKKSKMTETTKKIVTTRKTIKWLDLDENVFVLNDLSRMFDIVSDEKELLGFKNVTRILKHKKSNKKVFVKCCESEEDVKYAVAIQKFLNRPGYSSVMIYVPIEEVKKLIVTAIGDIESLSEKVNYLEENKEELKKNNKLKDIENQIRICKWKKCVLNVYKKRCNDYSVVRIDKNKRKYMSMLVESSVSDTFRRVTDVCADIPTNGDKHICKLPNFPSSFVKRWLEALWLCKKDTNMFNCMIDSTGELLCIDWCPAMDLTTHTTLITAQSVKKVYRDAGFKWCMDNREEFLKFIKDLIGKDVSYDIDCNRDIKNIMMQRMPFNTDSINIIEQNNNYNLLLQKLFKL